MQSDELLLRTGQMNQWEHICSDAARDGARVDLLDSVVARGPHRSQLSKSAKFTQPITRLGGGIEVYGQPRLVNQLFGQITWERREDGVEHSGAQVRARLDPVHEELITATWGTTAAHNLGGHWDSCRRNSTCLNELLWTCRTATTMRRGSAHLQEQLASPEAQQGQKRSLPAPEETVRQSESSRPLAPAITRIREMPRRPVD